MSLSELWFLLIAVLFIGFFFLEGFDFGVGMSTRFLARSSKQRRVLINTIGPFWDANEVWLITAGGAMFAAFPHWYATMFSGFYIPLVFMLLALILRGVAFEFRGKLEQPGWRNTWDWAIWIGSFLPPLLWGVVLANFMTGMPITEDMELGGNFLQYLHPFALLGGVMFVLLTMTHGLQFITLRTKDELQERARKLNRKVTPISIIALLLFAVIGYYISDVFTYHGQGFIIIPIIAWLALFVSYFLNKQGRDKLAFTLTSISIASLTASIFIGMFPRVMISSIDDAFSLTVYTASSGDYTLKLMTITAVILLPIVLAYTAWSYYIFRKRLSTDDDLEY